MVWDQAGLVESGKVIHPTIWDVWLPWGLMRPMINPTQNFLIQYFRSSIYYLLRVARCGVVSMLLPMLIIPDPIRHQGKHSDQGSSSQHPASRGPGVCECECVAALMNDGRPNQAVCLYTLLLLAQVSGSHDKKLTFSHFCGFYRV